jgi:hypothetical protein
MTEFNKYTNAQIYWIHCGDAKINQFYVGSTCNFFNRRNKHISDCYNNKSTNYNSPLYKYIRDNGGWNNFTMDTIEPYPCDSKLELLMCEQEWMNILEPKLNKANAYISQADLKELVKERSKNFYHINTAYRDSYNIIIECSNCDKSYKRCNKTAHTRSNYCKNYNNSTTDESSTE